MNKFTAGFGVVFKYNPYHDELGRFSTHDGHTFMPTGEKFKSTITKLKEQLAESKAAAGKVVYRASTTREDVEQHSADLVDATKDQYDALTDAEKKAIKGYTDSDYNHLNLSYGMAKGDRDSVPESILKKGDVLDSALASMHLPEDTLLYRAMDLSLSGIHHLENTSTLDDLKSLAGTVLEDHAYGSSSISPRVAGTFSKGTKVLFEIKARKGQSGAFVGAPDATGKNNGNRSEYPGEQEFIIPRGAVYKITGSRQVKYTSYGMDFEYNVLTAELN